MMLFSTTKIAVRAIGRNKMRSALTALGIIIGVGAVITMVGIGNGAKAQVQAQIASLGQNVIQVMAGSVSRGTVKMGQESSIGLTPSDAEAIEKEVPNAIAVGPEVKATVQVVAGNHNWSTSIHGEAAEYFDIREWPATAGEVFSEVEVRAANKVAVLGSFTAEQLFGEEDPVGETVRLKNVPFKVIGVLAAKGTSPDGYNQDDNIIVPYTTAMRLLVGQQTNLRKIYVQAASLEAIPEVEDQIARLLRQRHRIESAKDDDFTVRSQLEIAQAAGQTAHTLTLLLGAIASVSLMVGGIGIMNIMLVSVTERTREIGTRMAVGAQAKHILLQFLVEAFTLSSIGGAIGIAAGVAASKILGAAAHWPTLISVEAVAIAFLFSAAVGIFFGFYPARKASQLDPIEALRYE